MLVLPAYPFPWMCCARLPWCISNTGPRWFLIKQTENTGVAVTQHCHFHHFCVFLAHSRVTVRCRDHKVNVLKWQLVTTGHICVVMNLLVLQCRERPGSAGRHRERWWKRSETEPGVPSWEHFSSSQSIYGPPAASHWPQTALPHHSVTKSNSHFRQGKTT